MLLDAHLIQRPSSFEPDRPFASCFSCLDRGTSFPSMRSSIYIYDLALTRSARCEQPEFMRRSRSKLVLEKLLAQYLRVRRVAHELRGCWAAPDLIWPGGAR